MRWVTNLADLGPGSLRDAAMRPGPAIIRFAVSGVIRLHGPIVVSSDKTIDGADADVTIRAFGVRVQQARNIIIRNVTFDAGQLDQSDAIQLLDGARDVWLDHNDFVRYVDEFIGVVRDATDITISWNWFRDQREVLYVSGDLATTPLRVTVHHNVFDATDASNPRIRNAQVHAFDNYLRGWDVNGMAVETGGQLVSESNVFDATRGKTAINPGTLGIVRSTGDLLLNGATVGTRSPASVFSPAATYPYATEPAGSELITRLLDGAGAPSADGRRPPSGPKAGGVAITPLPTLPPLGTAVGFGAATTGGAGGETRWVTSFADSGVGSLRDAVERSGPAWVRFAIRGIIELDSPIRVSSDKTIDGRGTDITIRDSGLSIIGATNVIVTNLRFTHGVGGTVDAIQVYTGARNIWIDHCDFSDFQDGLVDITGDATDVTLSWNRFHDHFKVMLINGVAGQPLLRVTVHHNLFEDTGERHPKARHALVHAYNNVLRRWLASGVIAGAGSQILSEGNVYEAGADKGAMGWAAEAGAIRSQGDLMLGGAYADLVGSGPVFDPASYYTAVVDVASTSLITLLTDSAGVRPL